MGTAGKRLSTTEPLTEHDVAASIDRTAVRLLKLLMDVRQAEGDLFQDVKHSRYLSNARTLLAEELKLWE